MTTEPTPLAAPDRPRSDVMLSVKDVSISFFTYRRTVEAVRSASFDVRRGEMFGIVGETGSGKTSLAHALLNQVRFPGRIVNGSVTLDGVDILRLKERELTKVRGTKIALVSSNPRTALDPLATVGKQLSRALEAHSASDNVRQRALEALDMVRMPDAKRRYSAYPHELSVGMAQRVVIAMALLHSPDVVVADEPTTGLDVTVQRQVLTLLETLIADTSSSAVVVTHDLGVAAHFCQRIGVMYQGQLVEQASVGSFFSSPGHAYSERLLERSRLTQMQPTAVPRAADELSAGEQPLLSVRGLVKHFPLKGGFLSLPSRGPRPTVRAVNDVSFDLAIGEALGIVGESGSGKTTIGRLVLGLLEPSSGEVLLDGRNIAALSGRERRAVRPDMQMVFQEPHASLTPTMTVGRNIMQPLLLQQGTKMSAQARLDRVKELLELVHLPPRVLTAYPHHLSSGQAQRAGIARGIATHPRLLVLDEPTSRLDVSVRGEVLELLTELKEKLGMAYIFISHDLAAVRAVCDRVAVAYLGTLVEVAPRDDIFRLQRHPYSKALLASVLPPDPQAELSRFVLEGEIPSPVDFPTGCVLYSRCPLAREACKVAPPLEEKAPGWRAACHFSDELVAQSTED